MRNVLAAIVLCLLTIPAFSQPASNWQLATIMEVKPHAAAGDDATNPLNYDVTVKVGDTIYVVLYTTPADEIAPKDVGGRELLVLVGENTITYNNMLGRALQVPIESQRPATKSEHSR